MLFEQPPSRINRYWKWKMCMDNHKNSKLEELQSNKHNTMKPTLMPLISLVNLFRVLTCRKFHTDRSLQTSHLLTKKS